MTVYELSIGLLALILLLFMDSKSFLLPVSSIVFIVMSVLDVDLILNASLSLNIMIAVWFYENRNNPDTDTFFSIALKNKRIFPFTDNVIIALSKNPYVFMYLKEGNVIRLRCSLKELIRTLPALRKISRNTAISPAVKIEGKNRFVYNDKVIDSDMIFSWGDYPCEKDDT